jgi:ABC-type amino acid transport substrate-binding protein
MFRLLTVSLCFLLVASGCRCASTQARRNPVKIGIDSNWYPNDFGAQTTYINAFTEELLLEIAKQTGIEFERIPGNWDSLFDGMKKGKYDAVLSSLAPYNFNLAQYDFSENFLNFGPVLIVPEGNPHPKLENDHIGVITGDPAIQILHKYESVIVRYYPSIPEMLDAVANGEIEAALLDRVPAASYVNDLFAEKLKISGPPLTDLGLHLVSLKGKQPQLIRQVNQCLAYLKKKKRMQALLRKWQLDETVCLRESHSIEFYSGRRSINSATPSKIFKSGGQGTMSQIFSA